MKAILLGSIGVIAETSELQRQSYNEAFKYHGLDWYWSKETYKNLLKSSGGSKRIHNFAKKYNVDISIARIFNVYGPRMDPNDGRVISNFINQCLQGDPITIYGDGEQTRCFSYIDDCITCLEQMAYDLSLIHI